MSQQVHACQAAQSCPALATPWTVAHQAPRSMGLDSPGKNTAVGCHPLLQRIFQTQGSNPSAPALQADSLPLSQCRYLADSLQTVHHSHGGSGGFGVPGLTPRTSAPHRPSSLLSSVAHQGHMIHWSTGVPRLCCSISTNYQLGKP